jgi:beta-lactam-binding protein with PASTA domain
MSQIPPSDDPDDPLNPPLDEPPLVVPPVAPGEVRYVREERVVGDPVAPLAGEVDVNAVHEEERVRVLADGSVLRETDRIEQRSRFRDRLPWLLLALVGLLIAIGLIIWYVGRSSSKTVPAVVGLRIDAAVSRLQQDGFKVQIARQSNARAAGVVFGQNPAAATTHDDGSTVRLLVSKGRSHARVPNAVGLSQSAARDRLVRAGFRVVTTEVFSDQPRDSVVGQVPPAGGAVSPGGLVRLRVSKGSGKVNVPSEVGNPIAQARSDLAAKGLKPNVSHVPSTQPVDTVVAQNPSGGSVRAGSTVYLNVSKGAPTKTQTTTTPVVTATTTAPAQTTTTTQTSTVTATTTNTVTVPTTKTTTKTTTVTTPPTTVTTPSTSTTATSTTPATSG